MFKNNQKQYINIVKDNKQLKLDYKIMQDNIITKQEHSIFLNNSDSLPIDAIFKLNTLQKNIQQTYITYLYDGANQKILPTKEIDNLHFSRVQITSDQSVAIDRNSIEAVKTYFADTGVDYVLSPFHILYDHIQQHPKTNKLYILVYNNTLYLSIVNNTNYVEYSNTIPLTPFDDTQDESFLDDEIVRQKLYDEMISLEIQQSLNDSINEYYKTHSEYLEEVEFLYTLNKLTDDQIDAIHDSIMIPVVYKSISLEAYMDKLTHIDSNKYNFIEARVRKQNTNTYLWASLVLLSLAMVVYIVMFFTQDNTKQCKQTKVVKKEKKLEKKALKPKSKQKKEAKYILLDHQAINKNISQRILMLFDVVPYDAMLKDLKIDKDGSVYVINFVVGSKSLEDMRIKLKNIYKDSKVLVKHKSKTIINTIIENSKLIDTNFQQPKKEYQKYDVLTIAESVEYIKKLGIKNSIIKLDKKLPQGYIFSVSSLVKNPNEFFTFIDNLDKASISIHLSYPIKFSKVNNMLEIKYMVEVNNIAIK